MSEQNDAMGLLRQALAALGIEYSIDTILATGRPILTIEDFNGSTIDFVFEKHGDQVGGLCYWEIWRA